MDNQINQPTSNASNSNEQIDVANYNPTTTALNVQVLNNPIAIINPHVIEEQRLPLKITFTFIFFFTLTSMTYIHSWFSSYNIDDYSLCLWPIIYKRQYYRLITNHFHHDGLFLFIVNNVASFYMTKMIENQIGTMHTMIISLHSMMFLSLLYVLMMSIIKMLLHSIIYNFNFNAQYGISCVLFSLYTTFYLLKKNENKMFYLLVIELNAKYSSFVWLVLIKLIVINYSFFGNLCGILVGYGCILLFPYITFPKIDWICVFERKCFLNKNTKITKWLNYISLNEEMKETVQQLDQLDKLCDNQLIAFLKRKISHLVKYTKRNENLRANEESHSIDNNSNQTQSHNQPDAKLPTIDSEIRA